MSYEGDLVAAYGAAHKRLLGSPTVVKKIIPFVPHHPTDKTSLAAILLRLEGIERSISELNRILLRGECIKDQLNADKAQPRLLSVEKIVEIVCTREGISRQEIFSPQRHSQIVLARHFIFYLAAKWTRRSLNQIGFHIGGRDHSTVIRGIKKLQDHRELDSQLDARLFWYDTQIKLMVDPGDKVVDSVGKQLSPSKS